MVVQLSRKTVTARKAHRCSTCNGPIEPGEAYERQANVFDGHAYTWKDCRVCASIADEVWEWAWRPEEGISMEAFDEWASEYRDDPTHGESARAYLTRRGLITGADS